MNSFKKVLLAIFLIACLFLLVGCTDINVENESENSTHETMQEEKTEQSEEESNISEKTREAKKVSIQEEIISINKEYNVYIDGKHVATVSGKYINVTGDVFKLEDSNGNLIAQEKQIKRWGVKLNRLAKVMDKNENVTGYIGEDVIKDFFSVSKYKFHFYDKDKNEYAYTKEKILSLLYEFQVYNNEDEEIYNVSKNFDLISDSYTITKIKDSNVNMEDVIFLTCIVDAIRDSEE